jgi:hypothetical protein
MDTKLLENWACWYAAAKPLTLDPEMWRVDPYGRLMYVDAYGRRDVDYGWEVDHITPLSSASGVWARGSLDTLFNKQALNWRSNVMKSNRFPGDRHGEQRIDYGSAPGLKSNRLSGDLYGEQRIDYGSAPGLKSNRLSGDLYGEQRIDYRSGPGLKSNRLSGDLYGEQRIDYGSAPGLS